MSDQKTRNFKNPVVIDLEYPDETWKILEHAIHEIYNNNASRLNFEDLNRHAYNMVERKFGEKLYSGLVTTMTYHLEEISTSIEESRGGSFLELLSRKWNDHKKALQMIRVILKHMDQTYVKNANKPHVHELGLNLWRENIVYSCSFQTRLVCTLLDLVHKERIGEVIDRGLMRNVIKMLMDLDKSLYRDFEERFLEASTQFYKVESQKFIESCDCGDYLKKTEKCLTEEVERVAHYLDAKSETKITSVVEKKMIANYMQRLIHMKNSGLVNMLLNDRYEDLGRMYNVFRRVTNGVSSVREVMILLLEKKLKQLVTDPEKSKDPVEFVQCLSDEWNKYGIIICWAFNRDKTFHDALNCSFKHLINLNNRLPEFVSLFVDYKLQNGSKGARDDDVELILKKVGMLIIYLREKDVFEMYYKQHLENRLLSGKSISDDAERNLKKKLERYCGYHFTFELEDMFTDMKTSQDMMQGFHSSHPELSEEPTIAVQVLTTGTWPTQTTVSCNLPAEVSALCDKFRSYYLGTHKGRRLSWQTNMGRADIKAVFGKAEKHELNVSTFQMCVLMLFNNSDRLSYKEIEEATAIPAAHLKCCLQSLACENGKNVLSKEPMSKDKAEEDSFFVNDKFTSKLYTVKIGTVVAQMEKEPEKKQTRPQVVEDKRDQIDPAIVRIMKSRQVLDCNNLITEVMKVLQPWFISNPIEIKKRIESLTDRDFLERDSKNKELYRYVP